MNQKKTTKNLPDESGFRQSLRQELMKWYCRALYTGKVKTGDKSGDSSCTLKKA